MNGLDVSVLWQECLPDSVGAGQNMITPLLWPVIRTQARVRFSMPDRAETTYGELAGKDGLVGARLLPAPRQDVLFGRFAGHIFPFATSADEQVARDFICFRATGRDCGGDGCHMPGTEPEPGLAGA